MLGIQTGNKLSVQWSGNRTVQDQGSEYLLTVEIARSLFRAQTKKDGGGFVYLEASPLEVLENSEVKRGRLPSDLRPYGRIDVVLCDKKARPTALIEVKRYIGSIAADARRIAAILRRCDRANGGTIRYGAIAAITVLQHNEFSKVNARVRQICGRLQDELTDCEFRVENPSRIRNVLRNGEVWYSYAICLTMHRQSPESWRSGT
jgi:hypothetical protein